MKQFYIMEGFDIKIERESVLKSMDCYEDSPVYEQVAEEYEEIYDEMLSLVEPVGILGFGTLPGKIATEEFQAGTPVVYAVTGIGDGIKQCSTRAFREGDYVKGMLCDVMADEALFSMEERMLECLKEALGEHRRGILKRLEAPQDIPMEAQRVAWEYLGLKERFGIGISKSFMFDPVKTSCQIFVLTEDENTFRAQHDCRKCSNLKCRRRTVPDTEICVRTGDAEKRILTKPKESMMNALIREGFYFSAPCGGKGRCGKCRIQVLEGEAWISPEDEKVFTEEELREGWRLSCQLYPTEELTISFSLNDESEFEIISDCGNAEKADTGSENTYDVAVDIGTTTIAMELLGGGSGKSIHTAAMINSQRRYGADVISRIQASAEGKKEELRESIRRDLLEGVRRLTREAGISIENIRRISIAGNTTMGHLLMGYDCDTLGVYPFHPVNIDRIETSFGEIFGSGECGAQVTLLPGISTYVGGDIVSGLYACGFDQSEEICMLVDLGTNGEMAIGNREKILVTSTAAGPAFEGGNIAWGTGSVAGAICSVKLRDGAPVIKTLRDRPPVGICGTGVIETALELVKAGIVDETGLLDKAYFENGFPLAETADGKKIVFTRKDVRELQLAKAAVRAGVETLVKRCGIRKEQVAKVYLAGGFGYRLDTDKAIAIGMLPEEFRGRIEAVGNSSLFGAVKFLREENAGKRLERIVEISDEVSLSMDVDFQEYYIESMMFAQNSCEKNLRGN